MLKDINKCKNDIITALRNNVTTAVVGLSGGADSTLIALLSVEALGADNVYGIHMPYGDIDVNTFNARSIKLADKLGINSVVVPIGDTVNNIIDNVIKSNITNGDKISDITHGNTRARIRMTTLYAIAGELNNIGKSARVINTCNMSETYIGYDTKYGDGAGDIAPIMELYKNEVYQLLESYVESGKLDVNLIDYNPSAGLWDGQSDASELGADFCNFINNTSDDIQLTYDEMEPHVKYCITNSNDINNGIISLKDDITRYVWNRHITNLHKDSNILIVERGEW